MIPFNHSFNYELKVALWSIEFERVVQKYPDIDDYLKKMIPLVKKGFSYEAAYFIVSIFDKVKQGE